MNKALEACHLLIRAVQLGKENGDSVDWDDLDAAYNAAIAAVQEHCDKCGNEFCRLHREGEELLCDDCWEQTTGLIAVCKDSCIRTVTTSGSVQTHDLSYST